MARKTSLNPDIHRQLKEVVSVGVPIIDACAYVGITERTFYNWMRRGEQSKDGVFFQFFQDITRARVTARVGAVTTIRKSIADGNPQSAQWFLERSDPTNWGRKDKLTIDGNINIELINQAVKALTDAGIDATEVFNNLIAEAHAQRENVSSESD